MNVCNNDSDMFLLWLNVIGMLLWLNVIDILNLDSRVNWAYFEKELLFSRNLKSKQYIPKIKRTKSRRAFKCSMRAVWEHSKTRSYCKAFDVSDTLLAIGILRLDLIDMLTFPLALIGEHKLLNMKSTWLRITKFSQ